MLTSNTFFKNKPSTNGNVKKAYFVENDDKIYANKL